MTICSHRLPPAAITYLPNLSKLRPTSIVLEKRIFKKIPASLMGVTLESSCSKQVRL